jgi:hypothetical protein
MELGGEKEKPNPLGRKTTNTLQRVNLKKKQNQKTRAIRKTWIAQLS